MVQILLMPHFMTTAAALILPGSMVMVIDVRSIYNGYTGCVQRICG
ncbi:MAG TPA: NAD(P)H dehydrogenase subunit NdhS, partial [Prochlorococcus sp.]